METIQSRVDIQPDELAGTFLICRFEQPKSGVLVAGGCIQSSPIERRYIAGLALLFHLQHDLLHLFRLPGAGVSTSQRFNHHGTVLREFNCLVRFANGFFGLTSVSEYDGKITVSSSVMGVRFQGLVELLNRKVVVPGQKENPSKMCAKRHRNRIQTLGLPRHCNRFISPAHAGKKVAVGTVCSLVIWIQLDCSLELGFSTWPIPIEPELRVAQRHVSLGQVLVKLECFKR